MPDRFWDKFASADLPLRGVNPKQEDVAFTRGVLAMTENIDWNVGRILQKLDALQLAENTIVLYFSDNGPNSWRWNGGMKGKKGSTDEGGVRSPFLIRWPGHIAPGTRISQIAGAIDLLPTLAECAGVPVDSQKPLDGVSLKPLLLGIKNEWVDRLIYSHWAGKVSVRSQRYRLDGAGALFDMEADPGQTRDIARDQPDEAARLAKALAAWKGEMLPGLNNDTRPFPVGAGFPGFPLTQLPARDGVPHGHVKRSANAPNCSFFKDWQSSEDRITWDVEVAKAGTYEAIVYYTCPAAETGSTVELSLNQSRLEAVVTPANDPPLRGMEHDRVPREGESYVKDFQPLRLGEIKLEAGRGELTLRAVKVAREQVMDVRAVFLKMLKAGE